MTQLKVTEAEIIEVLLGDADPMLEARVRHAVRYDVRTAVLHNQWAAILPGIREDLRPIGRMSRRVQARVGECLAREPIPSKTHPADPCLGWAYACRLTGWPACVDWKRTARLGAIAALTAAVLFLSVYRLLIAPPDKIMATRINGTVDVVEEARDRRLPVREGRRIPYPTLIQTGAGGRAELRLSDQVRLTVAPQSNINIESPQLVRQNGGAVVYEMINGGGAKRFTVATAQGLIVDQGTEFEVSTNPERQTVVTVKRGLVRIFPNKGKPREAIGGERAILTSDQVRLEANATPGDLSSERAAFQTQILNKIPAPQSFQSVKPPAGVREITYPSGEMRLKAWVSDDPGDGQRRPAVVYLHGGYSFSMEDWQITAPYRQAGYIVMAPMLRGENDNVGNFEFFYGEVDDAVAAGKYVAKLPYVDPDRIYAAGHSIGGTMAIFAAMVPSPYGASASFGGSPDPRLFYPNWTTVVSDRDPREIRLRMPLDFPDSIFCPLTIYLGDRDDYLRQSVMRFVEDTRRHGKLCAVEAVAGTHHSALEVSLLKSIDFFRRIEATRAGRQ